MGTKHDAGGTDTDADAGRGSGMGTEASTGREPRADVPRAEVPVPGAKRSLRAVLTVVLGAIATLVSAFATLIAAASARITYYLPPPDGSTEATEHQDWIESVLALIPVTLLGGLLALVTTVLSFVALVRGREAASWRLALAALALVLVFAVLIAVPFLLSRAGTY